MIGWFAAHKAVALIGMALVAGAVLLLRHRGSASAADYGGLPVNPYATNSPPPAGGLTMFPSLPSPAPLQDPEPGGPAPGPQPDPNASLAGDPGAQVSTGPGAGPAMSVPLSATFVSDSIAPAFGMVGDLPAFQPSQLSFNPIYGGSTTIGSLPVQLASTTGNVSDVQYGFSGQALAAGGGVPALVDPSGHVVNAKGARVGGVTGD